MKVFLVIMEKGFISERQKKVQKHTQAVKMQMWFPLN